MSWMRDYAILGHDTFIVFIELKIEGSWERQIFNDPYYESRTHEVFSAKDSENCIVHIIEPDGLRRILRFTKGATINMNQNVFSYHSGQVEEIVVDEKEQRGKGKTRDKL